MLPEPQCMSDHITRTSLHISATQMHKARKTGVRQTKNHCLLLYPVFPDASSLPVTYREDEIGPSNPRAHPQHHLRAEIGNNMHISSSTPVLLHLVSPNACFFCPSRWKPGDLEGTAACSTRNQTHTHKISEPSKQLCTPWLPTPKPSDHAENREARGLPSQLP